MVSFTEHAAPFFLLQSLADDIERTLGNDFEEVTSALLMLPAEYDAHCLHECMHGNSTTNVEPTLIGILASRSTKVDVWQVVSGLFLAKRLFSLSYQLLVLHAQVKVKSFCSW